MRYWQKAFLPGNVTYLLGLIRDHKVRKRCFWHALACPTLGNAHDRDCHFMLCRNFWTANEFRPKQKTRTLSPIDAKPESENRQSVCCRPAKKQDPPHGQETHRLAQTKPTVSTQSRCGPSSILFSCHFPLAPKLGRRAAVAKFTYSRHSRRIPARPSDRRASQRMNEPTEMQLDLAPWYTQNASESCTFGSTTTTARQCFLA